MCTKHVFDNILEFNQRLTFSRNFRGFTNMIGRIEKKKIFIVPSQRVPIVKSLPRIYLIDC